MKCFFVSMMIIGFTSQVFSQSTVPAANTGKFQIGVNVSPDISYRTLFGTNEGAEVVKNLRDKRESRIFGLTTGVNVCYHLNERLSVETGAHYSRRGYQDKTNSIVAIDIDDPLIPASIHYLYRFHYIDIPMRVNYRYGGGAVKFIMSTALVANIFLKEMEHKKVELSNGTIIETTREVTEFSYRPLCFSQTISAGIDYQINSRMNLRIEPTFRHNITSIIGTPLKGFLWTGGINVGFYMGL